MENKLDYGYEVFGLWWVVDNTEFVLNRVHR